MSKRELERVRDESLAAQLRRVLGRPEGLRLVVQGERPSAEGQRASRVRRECATIFGEAR